MAKSSKMKAEAQFAKLTRADAQGPNEREIAERQRSEKIERLRALRLAKEAAERETAAAAKPARRTRPPA